MNYLANLVCRLRGHRWGRSKRISGDMGERVCQRCGMPQVVTMKTAYARRKAAAAAIDKVVEETIWEKFPTTLPGNNRG